MSNGSPLIEISIAHKTFLSCTYQQCRITCITVFASVVQHFYTDRGAQVSVRFFRNVKFLGTNTDTGTKLKGNDRFIDTIVNAGLILYEYRA